MKTETPVKTSATAANLAEHTTTAANAPLVYTETRDGTPDMGPRKRGDTYVWFGTLLTGICAIAFAGAGYHLGFSFWWASLIVLGVPCAYGIWCIYLTHRDRCPNLPRSHAVLAGELGFDLLCTSKGVTATAFFAPDSMVHGGTTTLFLFLENYMSRQRVVLARFGHLPGVGRPEATYVRLHLAAGQAAVYTMPVRAAENIPSGFHRLSVTLCVEQPEGVGQRLQGARVRVADVSTIRIAAPFELTSGRPERGAEANALLSNSRYVSLASISDKQPDLERLHALAARSSI